MSEQLKKSPEVDPRMGLILACVGLALAWIGLSGGSDTSASASEPAVVPAASARQPLTVTRMEAGGMLQPDVLSVDTPSVPASKPTDRSEVTKVAVMLSCPVELPETSVRGKVRLLSWPASEGGELQQWVDINDGVMSLQWQLPAKKTDGEALRHEARLLVPG